MPPRILPIMALRLGIFFAILANLSAFFQLRTIAVALVSFTEEMTL
jgi:hypothetical protein